MESKGMKKMNALWFLEILKRVIMFEYIFVQSSIPPRQTKQALKIIDTFLFDLSSSVMNRS